MKNADLNKEHLKEKMNIDKVKQQEADIRMKDFAEKLDRREAEVRQIDNQISDVEHQN